MINVRNHSTTVAMFGRALAGVMLFTLVVGTHFGSAVEVENAVTAQPDGIGRQPQPVWVTDMQQAMSMAHNGKRTILVDFTGSDWCEWCMKLRDEVFETPEFRSWSRDNLVTVKIDFPNDTSKVTEAEQAHHERWLKQFRVAGFPTIFLTDHAGRPFAKTGYRDGGPDAYIDHLKQLLRVRMLRDTAMGLAEESDGELKARFLDEALSTMDAQIVGLHYSEEIELLQQIGSPALREKYDQLGAAGRGAAGLAGILREDWMADPFGFLSADMMEAADHLESADTEPPVEEYHPRIEDRLAKLIELMNKT